MLTFNYINHNLFLHLEPGRVVCHQHQAILTVYNIVHSLCRRNSFVVAAAPPPARHQHNNHKRTEQHKSHQNQTSKVVSFQCSFLSDVFVVVQQNPSPQHLLNRVTYALCSSPCLLLCKHFIPWFFNSSRRFLFRALLHKVF